MRVFVREYLVDHTFKCITESGESINVDPFVSCATELTDDEIPAKPQAMVGNDYWMNDFRIIDGCFVPDVFERYAP